MGWYGTWNLEYTGKNDKKFINTAKLVIANFKKRFEISNGKNELEAVKGLSWYSADMDIEKILSYLEDGDQIHVLIDGETHPIREVISEGGYVTREGTQMKMIMIGQKQIQILVKLYTILAKNI